MTVHSFSSRLITIYNRITYTVPVFLFYYYVHRLSIDLYSEIFTDNIYNILHVNKS